MRRKNADRAVLAQVLEHVGYGFLGHRAVEIQLYAEIAGLGVHACGFGHRVEQRVDLGDLSEAPEIADEGQRIQAVAQHVATKAQGNVPAGARHRRAPDLLHDRFARGFFGDPGHGCGAEASIEALEKAFAGLAYASERRLPVVGGEAVQKRRHVVAAAEQQGDEPAIDGSAARTDLLQQAFHRMGELHDRVEVERSRRPLDGVGRAEDRGDRLGVLRRLFQPQQGVFHVAQQLAALDDVGLLNDRHAHERLLVARDLAAGAFFRFRGETTTGSPK